MNITLSTIKADVGSIGGHTRPSDEMLDVVRKSLQEKIRAGEIMEQVKIY